MIHLTSILAQTRTGAIIEIIIMLLIAGIIAFLTAYLYYKPIYTKKIQILETSRLELEKSNHVLRTEVSGLEKVIQQKEAEIEMLKTTKKKKK